MAWPFGSSGPEQAKAPQPPLEALSVLEEKLKQLKGEVNTARLGSNSLEHHAPGDDHGNDLLKEFEGFDIEDAKKILTHLKQLERNLVDAERNRPQEANDTALEFDQRFNTLTKELSETERYLEEVATKKGLSLE